MAKSSLLNPVLSDEGVFRVEEVLSLAENGDDTMSSSLQLWNMLRIIRSVEAVRYCQKLLDMPTFHAVFFYVIVVKLCRKLCTEINNNL